MGKRTATVILKTIKNSVILLMMCLVVSAYNYQVQGWHGLYSKDETYHNQALQVSWHKFSWFVEINLEPDITVCGVWRIFGNLDQI